ncbi:protein FAM170A isoform X2 [Tamandua tetradactyla]|uniref:protein FAM170A isoform X2 n=1 Tax=Tamandua tetradactyla TaxID=48850 RepID=UPI00405380EC
MKRRQKRKHLGNEEHQESAEKGEGIWTSQEDALQSRPTGVSKGWGLGLGELSSISEEYFSCVSFPHRLIRGGFWRLHQDSPRSRSPLAQVWEREAIPSPSQHVSLSSPSSYKTCASSPCVNKEERGMKIYYMQVQMKKGVAVSWEIEETSDSVEKQLRMEEATLPEDVRGEESSVETAADRTTLV